MSGLSDDGDRGTVLYNRGMVNAAYVVEAVRLAQEKYGKGKRVTGEQVRWAFENLDLNAEDIEGLGLTGLMPTTKVTCLNHEGTNPAILIQQWNGKAWEIHHRLDPGDDRCRAPADRAGRGPIREGQQHHPAHLLVERRGPIWRGEARKLMNETVGNVLEVNNVEVIYDHVILVLKGVSLHVPKGGIVYPSRRERGRQDDNPQGRLQPAARRARRGHQGLDPSIAASRSTR